MTLTAPVPTTRCTSQGVGDDLVEARAFLHGFALPPDLEASGPVEAVGVARDSVRLEIASSTNGIMHTAFHRLDDFLEPGDVLVVNNSGTLSAALTGECNGEELRLHISTPVPDTDLRLVELRLPAGPASKQYSGSQQGDVIVLPEGGRVTLLRPRCSEGVAPRLWEAELTLPQPLMPFLDRWGEPIRYSYVTRSWPLHCYQTVFAARAGSSEMPSAARPFSKGLVRRLVAKGVRICPLTLHTGVASLESHEPPYPEFYAIPAATSDTINAARRSGKRIIAVGTTVVRALETVGDADGWIAPGTGFTDLVITPERSVKTVTGLITGWHEPEATHLMMLEAIAGAQLLAASYAAALDHGYRWHEFGDSHLILP